MEIKSKEALSFNIYIILSKADVSIKEIMYTFVNKVSPRLQQNMLLAISWHFRVDETWEENRFLSSWNYR